MKSILYFSVFVCLLLTTACRDEDRIKMPQLQEGVNMRIVVDPAKGSFQSSNLANSAIEFDAYSINKNLSKVELVGFYYDDSEEDTIKNKVVLTLSQGDFVNGKAKGVITATQVATAFGLTGGLNGIQKDDEVTIQPYVTLTDGRVFSIENSAPSITSGTYASFTVEFAIPVK